MRRAISGFGLLLLTISFVWLVRLLRPMEPAPAWHGPVARVERPLMVVLDPGHGGADSGAMCGPNMEKDLTLDVALRAELLLRGEGCVTVLTRDSDRYVSLADRTAVGNHTDDSFFVSIHFNDGARAAASGVETYYALPASIERAGFFSWLPFLRRPVSPLAARSKSLARFIQASLVERTRAVDRGIKPEQFYVIANLRHPAVLVEAGFITNKSDMTKLATTEYRQEIALAISDGVQRQREAIRRGEPPLDLAVARPE